MPTVFVVGLAALLPILVLAGEAHAQAVYVTPGENGPVFSDKPRAGAKEVELRPLTVVQPTPAPPPSAAPKAVGPRDAMSRGGAISEPAYARLSIVSPQDNSAVAPGATLLDVRLSIDPPLAVDAGHAVSIRLNGQPVGRLYGAAEFTIAPEEWQAAWQGERSIQLDADVVDGNGQVLIGARPIRFYVTYSPAFVSPYVVPLAPLPPRRFRPVEPPRKDPPPAAPEKPRRNVLQESGTKRLPNGTAGGSSSRVPDRNTAKD